MTSNPQSGIATTGRLFWMSLGPMLLFLLTVTIALDPNDWFTRKDVLYFSILCGMILGRFAEFRGGSPLTATGYPATRTHLQRYIMMVLGIGICAWVMAHAMSKH